MPDGQRVVFNGAEKGRALRLYIQQLPDGEPRPISAEGTFYAAPGPRWLPWGHSLLDQGREVIAWELRALDGSETRPAPWIGQDEFVIAWSSDGRFAFVAGRSQPPLRVSRVDVATGRREPWLDTRPPEPGGVDQLATMYTLTPDGRYYAYSYLRSLSDLFLVEGLR